MPVEAPLQYDLFTGELKDARTREQRRRDTEATLPAQMFLFSQGEIAQFGVSANPKMDVSPGPLVLVVQDPRTEEEIEHDREQEAQRQTAQLFAEAQAEPDSEVVELEAETEPEIPILWLSRSDLIARRPDLAPVIQSLAEHEIEGLAALVGEALEEFYWIQVNVILSLYLDHELQLRLG